VPQVVAALLQTIQAEDNECAARLHACLHKPPAPSQAHKADGADELAGTPEHVQQCATDISALVDCALGGDTVALCALAQHSHLAASFPAMQVRPLSPVAINDFPSGQLTTCGQLTCKAVATALHSIESAFVDAHGCARNADADSLLQVLRVSIVVPHAPPLHALRITTALFHTLETGLRHAAAAGHQQGAPPGRPMGLDLTLLVNT
jgi:hypothetical protein